MESFTGDGGGGTVAGVDLGFVREGEDFVLDAAEEGAGAAAGEVGAADAVAEQNIATEEVSGGGGMEADAVG